MESWLDEPTLARVFLALAYQQAVAEKKPSPLECAALAKRGLFRHQYLVDQCWVAEKDEPFVEEAKSRRVTVLTLERLKKNKR